MMSPEPNQKLNYMLNSIVDGSAKKGHRRAITQMQMTDGDDFNENRNTLQNAGLNKLNRSRDIADFLQNP